MTASSIVMTANIDYSSSTGSCNTRHYDAAVRARDCDRGGVVGGDGRDDAIEIGRSFLEEICPELLDAMGVGVRGGSSLSSSSSSSSYDRLIKVGRNLLATLRSFDRTTMSVGRGIGRSDGRSSAIERSEGG